jgi:transcriptional regulator with XRE-family HTH domain
MAVKSDTNPIDGHIGRQVRKLRRARGITQAGLAKQLGMSFQQVQKYETGVNRISGSVLVGIAKALDVSVARLFYGLPAAAGRQTAEMERDGAAPFALERDDILADLERLPARLRRRILDLARALANQAVDRPARPHRRRPRSAVSDPVSETAPQPLP